MLGLASYMISTPRRIMTLFVISALAVTITQVIPTFTGSNSSIAPGVGAEQVTLTDSITAPVFAALFETPRNLPTDNARSQSESIPSFGFGQATEPSAVVEEDAGVAEVVVNVPVQVDNEVVENTQLLLRPTFSWVNVFSDASTLNGEPIKAGDVITAFDPQGTLVGRFTVKAEGRFGLMALYQDDPSTEIDEGASPGDEISFQINGVPAVAIGPHEPIWSSNGSVLMSNLAAVSS